MKGLGLDLIEIARIKQSIDRTGQKLLDKLFTSEEQAYCLKHVDAARHFAGRFAAKEAIVKALGTGFSGEVGWLKIAILNDKMGKPFVQLDPLLNKLWNNPEIFISITHSKDHAAAVAVWI